MLKKEIKIKMAPNLEDTKLPEKVIRKLLVSASSYFSGEETTFSLYASIAKCLLTIEKEYETEDEISLRLISIRKGMLSVPNRSFVTEEGEEMVLSNKILVNTGFVTEEVVV